MRNFLFIFGIAGLHCVAACTNAAPPIPVNTVAAKPTPPATNAPADPHAEEDNAPRISLAEAKKAYDAGEAVIVDVRDEIAYKQEHIKGSLNIPTAALDAKLDSIPKGKKIIAYCS
jgi:rhodanese-related sulfurtransferase